MSQELGKRNLYKLSTKEVGELSPTLLFPVLDKESELIKLFNNIKIFNIEKSDNFIEYYCEKHKISCAPSKTRTNLLNNLRVKKKRLNDLLEENFEIDRNYHIYQIKENSLENMIKDATNILDCNKIIEIKIFDTYTNKNKILAFNDYYKNKLKNILKSNGKVEFISVFDTDKTKDFCKDLLSFNKESDYDLEIKYIRKPIHQSYGLLYMLLTDNESNNYIVYFEETTRWSVTTLVTKKDFTSEFYSLLETRFDHFFTDKKLNGSNEIINVTLDLFQDKIEFEDNLKVIKLIQNMKSTLNQTNCSKKEIASKTNMSILMLKELRIIYPKMNYTNMVLFYYIKLIEIVFIAQKNKTHKTTFIFNQLDSFGIIKNLNRKIKNIFINRNDFLINKDDLPIDLKNLKNNIQTKIIIDNSSLAEVFSNLKWNNKKQIISSLNDIILDRRMSLKLINYYLKERSESLENNTKLIQYLVRKIFTLLKIEFRYKINEEEKSIMQDLLFTNKPVAMDITALLPSVVDDLND